MQSKIKMRNKRRSEPKMEEEDFFDNLEFYSFSKLMQEFEDK